MSQKLTGDGSQKGFAVGRGLLAAAETLNFSMGSSSQSHGGMASLLGGEGKDHDSQMPRRAGHISNTMKLFASLGLSPTDLDALAQVPEENISVETLPRLIMELKNRKMEAGRRMAGDLSGRSSETSYRSDRDDWGNTGGRMDRSGGQSQNRSQGDFGYSSTQDTSGRGYDMLDYGSGSGRDRQFSDLSCDSYRGLGMSTSSSSDDMFVQRRVGTPSQGKVQDFLGVMPLLFPHVCALCDFDVHSSMEWTQHTTGIRHSENRRRLLQMYPDWDPHLPSSSRMSTSLSLNTKGRSDGLLGAAPVSVGMQRSGMSSSWGSDNNMGTTNKMTSYSSAPKIRSRVVVAKYERKPLSTNSLFALATPFGTIREHLVLKNKAFLEMETHEEALAMANYYQRKPALLHGKEIRIYLSKELMVIEKTARPDNREPRPPKVGDSKVVFFSNLPRGAEQKMELLTVSRRFGIVEKHLFLNDEAFVQMSNPEDAEMLVKYHTLHPLTINRRSVRLNICTKYKTLTVPPGKGDQVRPLNTRRSNRQSDRPSRSQRSSSSKTRESLDEKAETSKKEEEIERKEDEEDEDADVMEARDGDEEDFDEEPSTDDLVQSGEPEESGTQEPDLETNVEHEEEPKTQEQTNDDITDDADTMECMKESEKKLEETQELEESAVTETENEENTEERPKKQQETEELNEEQAEDDGPEDDETQQEAQGDVDFPENLDEFVTLDELAEEEDAEKQDSKSKAKNSSEKSKDSGGLRVVNVVGFKRGYGYLDEILTLAKPFGRVVRHLVLDVRPEAFLELANEQEAKAMANFYSGNVIPSVCGKPVKVYHSHTYPTIQSGRVVYIGGIPSFKSSDASLLKIAEPFGKIKRYFLNRLRSECFIEMEKGEDAEKMVETCKENPPKFEGKRLLVYISRKYKQLKHGHRPPSPESESDKRPSKRERSEETETQSTSSGKSNTKKDEEPSPKKVKVEKPVTDKPEEVEENQDKEENVDVLPETIPEIKQVHEEEKTEAEETPEVQKMETEPEAKDNEIVDAPPVDEPEKSSDTEEKSNTTAAPDKKPESNLATLGPHDPNVPVGVEFVKMGYYCRVCFLFYSNEDTAKKVHCCSQSHYDKLKKHLEKEKTKAQSNGGKK